MYNKVDISESFYITDPIIDIRDQKEYYAGNIPGSINIPMDLLVDYPSFYFKKNIRYYLYCDSGNRSKEACLSLIQKGYNVVDLVGGYDKWVTLRKRF